MRAACFGSMMFGMMVIYLSQVRSVLVLAAVSILVFGVVLAWQKEFAKVGTLATIGMIVVLGSLALAIAVGGESVTSRLETLVEDRASEVYYANRGRFLEETVDELLPRYPFGAGMGRWGMMNMYFGDNTNIDRSNIWVEIQWTGWLLDGSFLDKFG